MFLLKCCENAVPGFQNVGDALSTFSFVAMVGKLELILY